jgi:hypothetical protein
LGRRTNVRFEVSTALGGSITSLFLFALFLVKEFSAGGYHVSQVGTTYHIVTFLLGEPVDQVGSRAETVVQVGREATAPPGVQAGEAVEEGVVADHAAVGGHGSIMAATGRQ